MRFVRLVWLIAILAGVVAAAPSAVAQGDMRARLEAELEKTEAMIERAADLAMEAQNRQAGEYVKQAIEVQKMARMSFRNGRYEASATRTQAARTLAEKALGLLVRPEEHAERVKQELEQTDEFLQMAHEGLPPDAPESAKARLNAAAKKQQRAWELFHDGRLRPALRMTHGVRQTLKRLRDAMPRHDPERFQSQLEYVDALVAEAIEHASEGDARQQRLAERAEQALNEARHKAARGDFRAAERSLEHANKLASEVLTGGGARDAYDRAVEQYQQQSERLRDHLSDTPHEEAARLYGESMEHFKMSQHAAQGNRDEMWRAGAEMRIAMRLLQQASKLVK